MFPLLSVPFHVKAARTLPVGELPTPVPIVVHAVSPTRTATANGMCIGFIAVPFLGTSDTERLKQGDVFFRSEFRSNFLLGRWVQRNFTLSRKHCPDRRFVRTILYSRRINHITITSTRVSRTTASE